MNFLLVMAAVLIGLVLLFLLAATMTLRDNSRSEGFVLFLLGPFPVFLRGRPWLALAAAAAVLLLFLLVML